MATLDELQRALAERDAEIGRLTAEIERLAGPPRPEARLDGPYIAPSMAQTRRLIALVHAAYPNLRPSDDDREKFEREVCLAFQWLGSVDRGPLGKINTQFAGSYWVDLCSTWLRERGSLTARGIVVYTAAIGAGDVEFYSPALCGHGGGHGWGFVLGLGRKPTNMWLATLSTGKLRRAGSSIWSPKSPRARRDRVGVSLRGSNLLPRGGLGAPASLRSPVGAGSSSPARPLQLQFRRDVVHGGSGDGVRPFPPTPTGPAVGRSC
jgi:hypothetical protein